MKLVDEVGKSDIQEVPIIFFLFIEVFFYLVSIDIVVFSVNKGVMQLFAEILFW